MMQHPVGEINAQEGEHRGVEGKPVSPSAAVLWDGQGTEFNRSFRKLSGSVISDKRPGKQKQRLVRRRNAWPPAPLSHGCRVQGENTLYSNKF